MAIYHFSAKIISRGAGRSAVAAAAYRAASRLHDERLGRIQDFTNKAGVVHSEVMLPDRAPERLSDRETLWNEVEAAEKRKDGQLAREVEFAIPREMTRDQAIALARDFVAKEFVSQGMVADLNVHWDIGADGEPKPHAHVMLTLRELGSNSFGPKVREWNQTALLQHWREAWANHVNARCTELGIEGRIDHRSHEARGIELEPQHKIGAAGARRDARGEDAERADGHRAIASANGARIVADPALGLETLTRGQATFTLHDLTKFAHRHSDGQQQFDAVLAAMRHHDSIIALGKDGRGHERFTVQSMLSAEQALVAHADVLAARSHGVGKADLLRAIVSSGHCGLVLGEDQQQALRHVTKPAGLGLVVGLAGSGKSAMLGLAREAWESAGYTVKGAALSGIAAENLQSGSGIAARTIASLEHGWARGFDRLTKHDVLVIDEAAMVGTRQLQRVLAEASSAGAKVVLVGDARQLQAIEAGAAFRMLAERHGAAELSQVRRQSLEWMRDATRDLALGQTGQALAAYESASMVHASPTREAARATLIEHWNEERRANPAASRIILTHMNKEVVMLNQAARARLKEQDELGNDVTILTSRGARQFANNDRILFLRNDRELGLKNGTLGTVEHASREILVVRLDDGRKVSVDIKSYAHVDHGYAATVHKTQGMTVDHTHLLATPGLDAHAAYVALSRHRHGTSLHYGRDDFADEATLRRTLGRERPKDMALDYSPGSFELPKVAAAARHADARQAQTPLAEHSERAQRLRAMVAARVAEAGPTSEKMREALARAANGVVSRGRGHDRGAER